MQEPKRFAIDLLEYINGEAQYLSSLLSSGGELSALERLQNSEMALEALANVMKHNKGEMKHEKNSGKYP